MRGLMMLKPRQRQSRRFWESLSDQQLLDTELTTDAPENLEKLVFVLPSGDEDSHVEYKYDLRGQEREKLRCIHCNQPHLAGFVVRKGEHRFLVGHICGNHIYGEDFDRYTADFHTAINRQQSLRKRREIEKETEPFMAWLEQVLQSEVFKLYESVRRQIDQRIPWIWDNVPRAAIIGMSAGGVKMPPTLFKEETDPRAEFARLVGETSALAANLIAKEELGEKSVENIRRVLGSVIRRIEAIFEELKEVEDFFQPTVLTAICKLANEYDNPKKRKYIAGLLSITCKRDRDKTVVQMPNNYRLPNRSGLEALKKSLKSL
jgi:hypothetical protein